MERGAGWTTVHGVAKSQTRLSDYHFHFHDLKRSPRLFTSFFVMISASARSNYLFSPGVLESPRY